jgi:hypothetical protein
VAAAADVIGIVTGVIGLVVGLVSLYLQIRSDGRLKQRTAPERPYYPGPSQVRPRQTAELTGWLAAIYAVLGSSNYTFLGTMVVHDPTRQIGSGVIGVVGAVSLLLFVRSRGGAWTRSVAYLFGVVGGALVLATGLTQKLPPESTLPQQLFGGAFLAAITLVVVFLDRRRSRNLR